MKKILLAGGIFLFMCVVFSGQSYSQTMDEIRAEAKAQARSELGLSATSTNTKVDRAHEIPARRKGTKLNLKAFSPENLDVDIVLKAIIVLMFLAFIPAVIANFKGRNFFLWWILGVLFFIFTLPVILLLKKKEGKTASKDSSAGEEDSGSTVSEQEGPVSSLGSDGGEPEDRTAIDVYEKIERLAALKEKGVISQEEFDSKKKELLDRI
ncbi:MAG: SHOCT domain-containing protein [Candidatus Tantalella remota]|nr:SHOCT domain-containing protein [Candidatus Tantalella remota]